MRNDVLTIRHSSSRLLRHRLLLIREGLHRRGLYHLRGDCRLSAGWLRGGRFARRGGLDARAGRLDHARGLLSETGPLLRSGRIGRRGTLFFGARAIIDVGRRGRAHFRYRRVIRTAGDGDRCISRCDCCGDSDRDGAGGSCITRRGRDRIGGGAEG